ncbi:hypothetical protein C6P42_001396 [Pichia californica]|nr:hypothetical protein C6P42_001396 [[Candida] californica]
MNVFRFLRNLLVFIASLYFFQHIYKVCPLNTPLNYSKTLDINYDPICVYSHKSYDLISPYVSSVTNYYDSSSIKPIIDKRLDNIKPGFIYVSNKFDKFSNYVSAYREAHEENVIQTLEHSSKNISEFINIIINFINNTVYPVVSECTKIILRKLNVYNRSIKIFVYLKWNIYIKPFILHKLEKFFKTKIGLYLLDLGNSKQINILKKIISYIYKFILSTYNYIYEKINYVYNINVQSKKTEAYELMKAKQAFLHDLAQYLPDSFNFKSQKKSSDSSSSTTTSISVSFSSTINVSLLTSTSTTINAPSASSTNEKYELLLKTTIESANKDFIEQINELANQYKTKIHSKFQPLIKDLASNVNNGYDKIHDQLNRINQYKDKNHPLYVSRQDYRDSLSEKKSLIEDQIKNIEIKLNEEIENYLDNVLKIRISIIETLEEFADSTLNAYSSSIIANGDDWQEWKKYKELKKSLINFRDELIDKDPIDDLSSYLNKLKKDAYVLTNESGSYMSILRAKANIEFQSREKEERELKEKLKAEVADVELDDEEEETSTITQTKFITQTLNSKHSEKTQIVDPIEEEATGSTSNETPTDPEIADPEVEDIDIVEQNVEAESEEEVKKSVDDKLESDASSVESIEAEYVVEIIPSGSDEVKVVLEPIESFE